jgi:hypothetical protein
MRGDGIPWLAARRSGCPGVASAYSHRQNRTLGRGSGLRVVGGGRQHRGVRDHLELPAVLRVVDQQPRRPRNSPICAPSSWPTAVTRSAPPPSGAIRAIV